MLARQTHTRPCRKAALAPLALALGLCLANAQALAQAPAPAHPRSSFDLDPNPAPPDYADPHAWAALPGKADAADLSPPGSRYGDRQAKAGVDVFFIHPTTLLDKAHWNQRLTDAVTNDWTDISVIARQASAFNACCRVYAPRYRQAGPGSVDAIAGDGGKAYDLAYQDVRAAFEYYLAHDNRGRPFILAGHSQGSLLLNRLVAELIDGRPLQRRFVAGYSVGARTLVGDFGGKFKWVQPCRTPAQTGCLAGWNTYDRDGDPSAYRAGVQALDGAGYSAEGKALFCVNPLTFDLSRPHAAAERNLGALSGAPGPGPLPRLAPGAAGADCVDGALMADLPHGPGLDWTALPKGSLHMHDIDTFYENLRQNAVLRSNAFLAAHKAHHD